MNGLAEFMISQGRKSRKDSSDYSIIQRPDCLCRRNEQNLLQL
jgi:hypothetical protein